MQRHAFHWHTLDYLTGKLASYGVSEKDMMIVIDSAGQYPFY